NRCHRQNMKTSIINGSEVSRLSVAIHSEETTLSKMAQDPSDALSGLYQHWKSLNRKEWCSYSKRQVSIMSNLSVQQ
ncbi:hypothetical protein NFR86_22650, partial [Enterobacter hormaechei]|uniref:hypothetical protein n=1 Tax=Enterobacter hormaechei TaxID=158836 RepID=UPI002092C88C